MNLNYPVTKYASVCVTCRHMTSIHYCRWHRMVSPLNSVDFVPHVREGHGVFPLLFTVTLCIFTAIMTWLYIKTRNIKKNVYTIVFHKNNQRTINFASWYNSNKCSLAVFYAIYWRDGANLSLFLAFQSRICKYVWWCMTHITRAVKWFQIFDKFGFFLSCEWYGMFCRYNKWRTWRMYYLFWYSCWPCTCC